MDIDSFIVRRRPDWVRLEQACTDGRRGLAKLTGPQLAEVATLYQLVGNDLAEVQTRYRDRQLAAYLSGVLASAAAAVYSARPRTARRLMQVFGTRYRQAVAQTWPYVLVAAAALFGSLAFGYGWVLISPEAQSGVLPPQAQEAIQRAGGARNPDLETLGPELSTYIFFNNVRVSMLAFALGITLGAGTLYLLVVNGFFVGTLGGAYAALGQAGPFWALIVPHGLLELAAICIAGGAGLRIGWAIVDPGDRWRSRALAEESAGAVLVIVGVVPAFLAAALIEGFVTGSGLPTAVQIGIGVAALAGYLAFLARRADEPDTPLELTASRRL